MVLRCGQCPRDTMCLCLIDDVDQKECIGFRFFLNYILCACVANHLNCILKHYETSFLISIHRSNAKKKKKNIYKSVSKENLQ